MASARRCYASTTVPLWCSSATLSAPLLGGDSKTWPVLCGEPAWDAIPHLQRLLGAARAAQIPVVHATKSCRPTVGHRRRWSEKPGRTRSSLAKADGTKWDIIDEAAPLPGETVIYKAAPSAFFGTLLMAQLNALDVDSLIICGESTSGCVRATVVDARSHRYLVTVVEECVFDRHQTTHAINLFDMHEKYADVLGIDEVVAHLNALRPASAAVPA